MRKITRKIEYRGFKKDVSGSQTIFVGEGEEQFTVTGYWVRGSLLQDCDTEKSQIRWFHDGYANGDRGPIYTRDEVIDDVVGSTVGQYVVVPQIKDNMGKPLEVCEGDVVECNYNGDVSLYTIVWDEDEQDFKAVNADGFQYLGCCEEIVIIGNIFDGVSIDKMKKEEYVRSQLSFNGAFKGTKIPKIPIYQVSDIVVQFARLWGMHEACIVNAKDEEISDMLKGYDSEEMMKLLIFWEEEYSGNLVEDTCDFFERKLEELYQENQK